MIIIAHRGNTDGPSPLENSPDHINEAISLGFDVEVDVWKIGDQLLLGHDEPTYNVNIEFLKMQQIWCHAKNIEALEFMLEHGIHCFWHEDDDYTVTSKAWVWAYPGQPGGLRTITVMPEMIEEEYVSLGAYGGVCTDYPYRHKP